MTPQIEMATQIERVFVTGTAGLYLLGALALFAIWIAKLTGGQRREDGDWVLLSGQAIAATTMFALFEFIVYANTSVASHTRLVYSGWAEMPHQLRAQDWFPIVASVIVAACAGVLVRVGRLTQPRGLHLLGVGLLILACNTPLMVVAVSYNPQIPLGVFGLAALCLILSGLACVLIIDWLVSRHPASVIQQTPPPAVAIAHLTSTHHTTTPMPPLRAASIPVLGRRRCWRRGMSALWAGYYLFCQQIARSANVRYYQYGTTGKLITKGRCVWR